ncbi:THUMP domain-containing protein [Hyperthermus butylicus]|uniref:Conserved archaeal protein n=1 Tax=Hyperthermus butylicus (strain DSM 5456 / JCM 9403 / PLM1-5) TaxID=415426 RepID=A2BNA7_HYPBU|nr:THUMP domain-containing protein [Hyperthermus butylicus]ABM81468.1 conserved archaeal protein [Hyperthermus butylicus DSM 5456]
MKRARHEGAAALVKLLLTTNPGIEDIAAHEAEAKISARLLEARDGFGRLYVEVDEDMLEFVEEMRSIHRAVIVLAESNVCPARSCLEKVYEIVKGSGVDFYVTPWTSFAVRAERAGTHEYTSLDIARVAGDAVIDAVKSRYGVRPPVDLDYPAVVVAVEVIEDNIMVGIDIGGELSWHRRGYRIYDHPAALKPTLAYAMLLLSGAADGDTVMDPMCGGGTIAIEAAYIFEDSRIICMDKSRRHIEGAVLNARAAMVEKRIEFIVGDATKLRRYVSSVDVLVSNPPYGIRARQPEGG